MVLVKCIMTLHLLFRGISFLIAWWAATSSPPVLQKHRHSWQVFIASAPEVLPMASREGEPALMDSVISTRQKPHLWEPGWFFCFNEAKVASIYVCACLQSDSDLSQAESKFRALPGKHIHLPASLWQMPMACQILSRWLPQRDPPVPLPKAKNLVSTALKTIELSPSPPVLSWTHRI